MSFPVKFVIKPEWEDMVSWIFDTSQPDNCIACLKSLYIYWLKSDNQPLQRVDVEVQHPRLIGADGGRTAHGFTCVEMLHDILHRHHLVGR